jgi:integrase
MPWHGSWTRYKRAELRYLTGFTPEALFTWVMRPSRNGRPPANNSIRQRASVVGMFAHWLVDTRQLVSDPTREFRAEVRRKYPRIYGKRQAANPARFLTYEQAFGPLLEACKDGTWRGSRDQLAFRLGLLGLRRQELINLDWRHYHDGEIALMGKGNRLRTVRPGPVLTDLLARWQRKYEAELGRPVAPGDPILCGTTRGRRPTMVWGRRLDRDALNGALERRAEAAGLGHVSPHDLRRSAASIMHHTLSADGGHVFDLLDIQRTLDHADPATTQRSYLDQLDTSVKTKAGQVLD